MSSDTLLARARKYISTAARDLEAGDYESSASRSYYATYFATKALLAEQHLEARTHSGTHVLFHSHFIKTDKLPVSMAAILTRSHDLRMLSDYAEDFVLSELDARSALYDARTFVDAIEHFLREK